MKSPGQQVHDLIQPLYDKIDKLEKALEKFGIKGEEDLARVLSPNAFVLAEPNIFARAVKDELVNARKNHPPMASVHEGYAVILEELDEFWAWAKLKPALRNSEKMYDELVQIAAMAQRTAEDLKLGDQP